MSTVSPGALRKLRRLQRELSLFWAGAWIIGIAVVLAAAARLSLDYRERDLDADLALHAMAVYGLAWVDKDGVFHDEFLRRESLILESPFDIWAIEPGDSPRTLWHPDRIRFEIDDLPALALQVVRTAEPVTRSGIDEKGRLFRLRAIPSFDDDDVARVAIVVVGDREPGRTAHLGFVRGMVASSVVVAVVGLAIGIALARRSLKPVAEAYIQRERFLGGAAHELRNPVASLRAICESAAAGDEAAERALERLLPVVLRTGDLVDKLLLFARLDSERPPLAFGEVRLDLLVERCLPEDRDIVFVARESVVWADAALVEVAVSNMVANALTHARRDRADAPIQVEVSDRSVTVSDGGPGFTPDVLEHATEPFVSGTRSRGVGLGLALVQLIVELHDGELILANGPEGGARVEMRLSPAAVSRSSGRVC